MNGPLTGRLSKLNLKQAEICLEFRCIRLAQDIGKVLSQKVKFKVKMYFSLTFESLYSIFLVGAPRTQRGWETLAL